MRRLKQLLGFGVLFISLSGFALQSPSVVIKNMSASMVASLSKHQNELSSNYGIIKKMVERLMVPHVDVARMTGSILGRQHWRSATAAQKAEVTKELKAMIIETYAAAFAKFDNDKVMVRPIRGSVDKAGTQVDSVIVRPSGQRISVNYSLYYADNHWQITDISIEHLSMVQSYRSQFASVLGEGGVPLLIQRLKAHNSQADA